MHGTIFAHWFFHPLRGLGYQFWSGIAGSFLTSLPGWFAALAIYLTHHNCQKKGCWRMGHPHPKNGHPACRHHREV